MLIHRDTDARACGATTVTAQASKVFAEGELISINGDPNSHGGGALAATANKVYVGGTLIVLKGDSAGADALCPPLGGAHCAPSATGSAGKTYSG